MKRKLKVLVDLAVVAMLAFPLLNLVVAPDNASALPRRSDGVPRWSDVAPVFVEKCVHCHTSGAKLPFYASFPVAKGMMQQDIAAGLAMLDMTSELYREGPRPLSEAALAKTELAVTHGEMPPGRYLLLHWNHRLSEADKQGILGWVRETRRRYFTGEGVSKAHAGGMLQPLPRTVEEDPAKVALGERLFHDKRLSKDNSLSCSSCHALDKGGTDRARFSTGIKNQLGGINSPTVFNAGLQYKQFWDGRAADLFEQADGPVNNPIEMGSSWKEVLPKLAQDAELVAAFTAVYPGGLSGDRVRDAIAAFERSLVTPSRFDRFLRGDSSALKPEEKRGFELFTERGCASCHVGQVLGGQSFEKMGIFEDYFAGRKLTDADRGRFNVTKREVDLRKLKVPMLRNITLTAPYFHDGSVKRLDEAVATMGRLQLEDGLDGDEVKAIVAFLGSLTGELRGKQLR